MIKRIIMGLMIILILPSSIHAKSETIYYENEGKILYELGLIEGYGKDEMILGLEDKLTRELAMKLMADIMGWDVDTKRTSSYTDVSSWAQPYVAVAVDYGITNGNGQQFGGDQVATMHELTTWFLRALGYKGDEAWEKADQVALDIELINLSDLKNFQREVNRDRFVGMAYRALTCQPLEDKRMVIEILIDEGYIDEQLAMEKGLIELLTVEDIKSLNLVQTEVIFNKAIDVESALDRGNYKIKGRNLRHIDLRDDYKGVILTHSEVQDEEMKTIEIDNILSQDKTEKIVNFTDDILYKDKESPEILGVELIDWNLIQVTLSEPICSVNPNKVDIYHLDQNKQINISKVTSPQNIYPYKGGRSNSIQEYSQELFIHTANNLSRGNVNLDLQGIKDFNGNEIKPYHYTLEVKRDHEPAQVIGVEVISETEVHFIFDKYLIEEEIELINKELKEGGTGIYHTNAKYPAEEVKLVDKTLKVYFDIRNALPEGNSPITIATPYIKDHWGNTTGTIITEVNIPKQKKLK